MGCEMIKYYVGNQDISDIINSKNTSIITSLCTNTFMSATDEASFSVVPPRDLTLYQSLIQTVLSNRDSGAKTSVRITKDNSVIFNGYMDYSELSIISTKIAGNVKFNARSRIILFDSICELNAGYEKTQTFTIIQDLCASLSQQLGEVLEIERGDLPLSKKVSAIAFQEDDGKTYRQWIDTILQEAGGYVLYYDCLADKFTIKKIARTSTGNESQVVYRLDNKLTTQHNIYDYDGVLVNYPTISKRENQNLYAHSIDVSLDAPNYDDSLAYSIGEYVAYNDNTYRCKVEITTPESFNPAKWDKVSTSMLFGEQVKPTYYFPEDADIKANYFEYDVKGLDREYITKQSRLQNEDLALIYAKDCQYELISSPTLSLSPALPNIEYTGITYLPRKAWIVFRNDNASASNVTGFSITGTVIYRSKNNQITAPISRVSGQIVSTVTNPEELTATTITELADVKEFANFIYNFHKYGQTISQWTETPDYNISSIGAVVNVVHKNSGIVFPSVVTKVEYSFNGSIILRNITAVSIKNFENWNNDDLYVSGNDKSVKEVIPPSTVIEYSYGSEEQPFSEEVGTSQTDNVVGFSSTVLGNGNWTSEQLEEVAGKYIWVRIGTYTPPQTKEQITNWVVYRLAGRPKEFNLTASSYTYVRNMRNPRGYSVISLYPQMTGYNGMPTLKVYINSEGGKECTYFNNQTNILTVPYNVSTDIKRLVCVFELKTETENIKQTIVLELVDTTGDISVFGHTIEPKTASYDAVAMAWVDEKGNYLLTGDSYVLVNKKYIPTTDEVIDTSKTYYKFSGGNYYKANDLSYFPYVNQYQTTRLYEIQAESKVMAFTGSEWLDLANSLNRDTYQYYDRNLIDNISNVFDVYKDVYGNANHIEANGYDWFKQIIAQYINAVYYHVGGAIYGGAYNYQGVNPTNGRGFYLDKDGNFKAYGVDIAGNSFIHGNTVIGGTVLNTLDDSNESVKIFETQKSTEYGVEFEAKYLQSSKSFAWEELRNVLNGYYERNLTNNNIATLKEGAYINGKLVKYICIGSPSFVEISETIGNTSNENTYIETTHFTVPSNYPKITYKMTVRQTAASGSNWGGGDLGYRYGRVDRVLIRDGKTYISTIFEASTNGGSLFGDGLWGRITDIASLGITNVVGGWVNGLEVQGATYTESITLQSNDTVYYRVYGAKKDKHNHRQENGYYSAKIESHPFVDGANILDADKNYLGTISSLLQEAGLKEKICSQPSDGFINVVPTQLTWSGNPDMTFNYNTWSLEDLKPYYKMTISTYVENNSTVTDGRKRNLTVFEPLKNGVPVASTPLLRNTSQIVCFSVTNWSLSMIIQGNGENSVYNFYTDSYGDPLEFNFCFKCLARGYGAYSTNLFPLLDNESVLGSVGNLGSPSEKWKNLFCTNGNIDNLNVNSMLVNNQTPVYVIDSYNNGNSWWRKWSNGWIEQGGVIQMTRGSTSSIQFSSPYIPFADTNYTVQLTGRQTNLNATATLCASPTNVSYATAWYYSSSSSFNQIEVSWEAKGYMQS